MSKVMALKDRTQACLLRILRGQLQMEMREFRSAQRSAASKGRQRHMAKPARLLRGLVAELDHARAHASKRTRP